MKIAAQMKRPTRTCSGDDICYEDDDECSIVSVGNKFAFQTTEILRQ